MPRNLCTVTAQRFLRYAGNDIYFIQYIKNKFSHIDKKIFFCFLHTHIHGIIIMYVGARFYERQIYFAL